MVVTGVDIIEVERIRKNIEDYGENFLNKIYTEKEIRYCESKIAHKFESYSARFAAKEAVFKAVSSLLKNKFEIDWKNIEIINDENGKPYVNLILNDVLVDLQKIKNIDISISHVKELAIASCVLEY